MKTCLPRLLLAIPPLPRRSGLLLLALVSACSREPEPRDVSVVIDLVRVAREQESGAESSHSSGVDCGPRFIEDVEHVAFAGPLPHDARFDNVRLGKDPKLRFQLGITRLARVRGVPAVAGQGAVFSLEVAAAGASPRELYREVVDLTRPEHLSWLPREVDLAPYAGTSVSLRLHASLPEGFAGNAAIDPAKPGFCWARPILTFHETSPALEPTFTIRNTTRDLLKSKDAPEIVQESAQRPSSLGWERFGDEPSQRVLVAPPPSRVRYRVDATARSVLTVDGGILLTGSPPSPVPEVLFEVIEEGSSDHEPLLRLAVGRGVERRFHRTIDLSSRAGREVSLLFRTQALDGQEIPDSVLPMWSTIRVEETRERERESASAERPNLLFVMVDTLRADHLGCYGYSRETSPNLDRLAAKGVLFETCIANASWTSPSVATMFSGLYPYTHGVIDYDHHYLVDSIETLAERLQSHGFTTSAFITNYLIDRESNFAQGFETFEVDEFLHAADVNERFLSWLDRAEDYRFFAYLHYIDPHSPYAAPGAFRDFFDPDYSGPLSGDAMDDLRARFAELHADPVRKEQFKRENQELLEAAKPRFTDLYDGEIRYWDHEFGKLLDALERRGLAEKTLILFCADHGEGLLAHGRLGHGANLFDELLRVPLVLAQPRRLTPRRRSNLAQLSDIYPTVCELLDVPYVEHRLPGTALVPLGRNPPEPRAFAFSSTATGKIPGDEHLTLDAIRSERFKLVLADGLGIAELYDLRADPGERSYLIDSPQLHVPFPAEALDLQNRLRTWKETQIDLASSEAGEGNPDVYEKMKALGYVGDKKRKKN